MHVYEKAVQSQIGEVYVATCDEEIALEVRKNGGKFIMTDINHTTGTDRVFEASQKLNLKDIGGITFNLDLHSIHHEKLTSRIYIS